MFSTDSINIEGHEVHVSEWPDGAVVSNLNSDGTIDYNFEQPTMDDLAGLAELERQAMVDEFSRMIHGDRAL